MLHAVVRVGDLDNSLFAILCSSHKHLGIITFRPSGEFVTLRARPQSIGNNPAKGIYVKFYMSGLNPARLIPQIVLTKARLQAVERRFWSAVSWNVTRAGS